MLNGGCHGHGEPRDANAAKKEWHSRRVVLTAVLVTRQVVPCIQRIWFSLTEKLSGTLVPGDSEISRVQLLSFTRTCATVERDADDSNHSTFLYVESSKAVSGTQLRAPDYRQTGAILGLFLGASRYISYQWMDDIAFQ